LLRSTAGGGGPRTVLLAQRSGENTDPRRRKAADNGWLVHSRLIFFQSLLFIWGRFAECASYSILPHIYT
ncbi:hypothetical protein GOODEAATRI_000936, partial [Goodea atripinnis]